MIVSVIARKERNMVSLLNLAMAFLVLGVIMWSAYWAGVPGFAIQISWILSSIGILLLMISLITGRTADKMLGAKNVPPAIE